MTSAPAGSRTAADSSTTPRQRKTALLLQNEPVNDHERAVISLMGSVLLGAIDHVGAKDLRHRGHTKPSQIKLGELISVFTRSDTGLHGCAFEHAVHSAINGDPGIPQPVRDCVLTATSGQVQLLLRDLGVPTDGWQGGLRSVMFGMEKSSRDNWLAPILDHLGTDALLWPDARSGPVQLNQMLTRAAELGWQRGFSTAGVAGAPAHARSGPRMPDNLRNLSRTDLLLGGARVRTDALPADVILTDPPYAPTAWISASLKWQAHRVKLGQGLHLGIETDYKWAIRKHGPASMFRITDDGHPVLTLPLDGIFVRAFIRANYIVRTAMRRRLRASIHPVDAPDTLTRQLQGHLAQRKSDLAIDVAYELLQRGQRNLAKIDGNSPMKTIGTLHSRTADDLPDERAARTLAAVPQTLTA